MIILKSNIGVGIVLAIFVTLVIPGIVFIFKLLREKTGFLSDKYSELLKLKNQLSDIERQISSFKQINDTGRITQEEKNEWIQLTKNHKIINEKIITLKNKNNETLTKWDDNPIDTKVYESILNQKENTKLNTYSNKQDKKSSIQVEYPYRYFNIEVYFFIINKLDINLYKWLGIKIEENQLIINRLLLYKVADNDIDKIFNQIKKELNGININKEISEEKLSELKNKIYLIVKKQRNIQIIVLIIGGFGGLIFGFIKDNL